MANDEYGVRMSQAGVPVDKAADYQMVLDDRWPMVEFLVSEIIDVKNATIPPPADVTVYIPIYKHDLGYTPAYIFREISYSGFSLNSGEKLRDFIFADEKYIYVQTFKVGGVTPTINVKFFLAVFNRDCSQDFTADIDIVTAEQSSGPSDYGIKVIRNRTSRGIDERNKSGYSLNTNAKALAYQRHGTQVASGTPGSLTIIHRLGYPPTYLLARYAAGFAAMAGKQLLPPLNISSVIAKNTVSTLSIRGGQANLNGTFLFIVLKDPVDLAR